jgi:hypothetical protein
MTSALKCSFCAAAVLDCHASATWALRCDAGAVDTLYGSAAVVQVENEKRLCVDPSAALRFFASRRQGLDACTRLAERMLEAEHRAAVSPVVEGLEGARAALEEYVGFQWDAADEALLAPVMRAIGAALAHVKPLLREEVQE